MSKAPRPSSPRTSSVEARALQRLFGRVRTALGRWGSDTQHVANSSPTNTSIAIDDSTSSSTPLVPQPAVQPAYRTVISHCAVPPPIQSLDLHTICSIAGEQTVAPNSRPVAEAPQESVQPSGATLRRAPIQSFDLDTLLAADDDENIEGLSEEAIVPLAALGRTATGITEAKAKQFFERHGLTYNTRAGTTQEPAPKVRRVEKQIRIRVRWTCHSCHAVFGHDRNCLNCGHRRCFECERSPQRRLRMPVPEHMSQQPELRLQVPGAHVYQQRQQHHITPYRPPVHTSAHQHFPHGAGASPWRCTIQIGQPHPGPHFFQYLTSTSTQRRDCHQCESTRDRLDQSVCTYCGHQYCVLCPMCTNQASHPMHARQSVPVVERVFRKPRQRVRFRCEQCDTQYTDRNHCAGCGHERCENCPRFPPRKRKLSLDSTAWQALEAKITSQLNPDPPAVESLSPLHAEQPPHPRL